jgi:hypothetical protein
VRGQIVVLVAALFPAMNGAAAPPSQKPTLLRLHSAITITAHGVAHLDDDFVVTTDTVPSGASASPGAPGGRAIFGFENRSALPGEGPVLTSFFRGSPTRRALTDFQAQIASLRPDDLPAECSIDQGNFMVGTSELTLYHPFGAQVITVRYDPAATLPPRCPQDVETLFRLVGDFITRNTRPIS